MKPTDDGTQQTKPAGFSFVGMFSLISGISVRAGLSCSSKTTERKCQRHLFDTSLRRGTFRPSVALYARTHDRTAMKACMTGPDWTDAGIRRYRTGPAHTHARVPAGSKRNRRIFYLNRFEESAQFCDILYVQYIHMHASVTDDTCTVYLRFLHLSIDSSVVAAYSIELTLRRRPSHL